jgi:hypothetical protein
MHSHRWDPQLKEWVKSPEVRAREEEKRKNKEEEKRKKVSEESKLN